MLSLPVDDIYQPVKSFLRWKEMVFADCVIQTVIFGWNAERIIIFKPASRTESTAAAWRILPSQASLSHPLPPCPPFSQGVIIVNHLITEARVNPRFWARWKVSRWSPQTPSRQQIKADTLWWSCPMSLWYCSTQRSADLGWMTKFDRTFQPIPLPFPFKVSRCAAWECWFERL